MPLLPSEIPTGLVTGQFYFVSEDGSDADTDPTLTNVQGTVTFTCSAKMLRMPTKMATVVPLEFKGTFNAQGQLISISDGSVGIELPATDSTLFNPTGFTWTATFDLIGLPDRHTVNLKPITFQVPEGSTVSLTAVTPVDETPGVITIQGPKGDTGATGATGPQGIQGIQGIKGDKGDPGGIVKGTNIAATTNLDTLFADGVYYCPATSRGTALGYPHATRTAGTLVVNGWYRDGQDVIQTFTAAQIVGVAGYDYPATTWKRSAYGGVWSPWRVQSNHRVDQTAGRAIYQWDDLNNREQLIYGDTGLRAVDGLLDNTKFDNTGNTRTIRLRRVGNVVSLAGQVVSTAAITSGTPLLTLPLGFRQDGMTEHLGLHTPNSTLIRFLLGNGNYNLTVYWPVHGVNLTWASGQVAQFSLMWTTTDPWPTTLPGTAVGTIPNL